MKRIIAGVDGSPPSRGALRWAWREARLHRVPLVAIMAWGFLDEHRGLRERFTPEFDEQAAWDDLDRMIVDALGADALAQVERRAARGAAQTVLLDAAGEDDLLVIGPRGAGGFRALVLGSVTRQLLHHGRSPLVVVHGAVEDESAADRGPVVAGVDRSEHGTRALRWALGEARARCVPLAAVHTWQPVAVGADPYLTTPIDTTVFEDSARSLVEEALAGEDLSGVPDVTTVVRAGSVVETLIDESRGASVLAVGSRGHGGFAGLLLGSVTDQVAHHAACPVAVIR